MRRLTTKTHHVKEIWQSYAVTLLGANPEWWGVPYKRVKNYFLYRKYTDEKGRNNVIEVFNYKTFKRIVEMYFSLAKDAIIRGEALDMTSGVGKICARRVERNHAHKTINFAKTMQQPMVWNEELGKEVRKKIIYHTSDDWCRIGWHKFGKMKNETMYEFVITKNLKSGEGFNQMLVQALTKDPFLKYKYIYYPLINTYQ